MIFFHTEPSYLYLRKKHRDEYVSLLLTDEEKKLFYGKSWSSQAQKPSIEQLTWILPGTVASLKS